MSNTHVQNIDIGNCELYVAGRNVGYLMGDTAVTFEPEILELKQGCPAQTVAQAIIGRKGTVTAKCLELTSQNYLMVSGDGTLQQTGGTSTPTNVTDEAHTFADGPSAELPEGIEIQHTNLTNIVVKSSDSSTTYTLTTDYTINTSQAGMTVIQRVSAGAIETHASVLVSYTYTSTSTSGGSTSLLWGANSALTTLQNVVLHKYNPRSGKHLIIQLWAVQSSGAFGWTFSSENSSWLTLDVNFTCLSDPDTYPTCPQGMATWADTFDINNLPTPGA